MTVHYIPLFSDTMISQQGVNELFPIINYKLLQDSKLSLLGFLNQFQGDTHDTETHHTL